MVVNLTDYFPNGLFADGAREMSQVIEFVKAMRPDSLQQSRFLAVNERRETPALKKARVQEPPAAAPKTDSIVPTPDFVIGMPHYRPIVRIARFVTLRFFAFFLNFIITPFDSNNYYRTF